MKERQRFEIEQAEHAKEREAYGKQQEELWNRKKAPATNPRKRPADSPSNSPPSKAATQDGNLLKYFSVLYFMSSARFLSTAKPRQRGKQYFARRTYLSFSFGSCFRFIVFLFDFFNSMLFKWASLSCCSSTSQLQKQILSFTYYWIPLRFAINIWGRLLVWGLRIRENTKCQVIRIECKVVHCFLVDWPVFTFNL